MKLSGKRLLKYFYFSLVTMWVILTMHILYLYTVHNSSKKPIKGGTLLEASFDKANYIPYVTTNNSDNFYKSFLYNSCLQPYVDDTKIEYKNDLCVVNTKDNKTYEIQINGEKKWSDGNLITLEDVYFTYANIIKENIRNLSYLDKYKNITIELTGDNLIVSFPIPSIDNKIFFTNTILPKNVVDGLNIENYIDRFATNPVKSGCGEVVSKSASLDGFIFDLTNCESTFLKYYQVKNFNSEDELTTYLKTNPAIDIYNGSLSLSGYIQNKVILNKFISIFFNTSRTNLDSDTRKSLANFIHTSVLTGNYENYIKEDKFLFDAEFKGENLGKRLGKLSANQKETILVDIEIPSVPQKISLNSTGGVQDYFLGSITDRFTLSVGLQTSYDSISINHNGKGEYKLQSYNSGALSFVYNLSEGFKNVVKGKNTYQIKGYKDTDGKTIGNIVVYYIDKPKQEVKNENAKLSFSIVYYDDEVSNFVADSLKSALASNGIDNYFQFINYSNSEDFRNRLSNKDYDIVIRGIDMGLKRDISTLFQTNDNPEINPSLYKNLDLASLINQYFITEDSLKKKIKAEIDSIYQKDVPLILIGKTYGIINLREGLGFTYPERLYDYWFRKDYGGSIQLAFKPYIEKDNLLNFNNFYNFIKDGLKFDLINSNNN